MNLSMKTPLLLALATAQSPDKSATSVRVYVFTATAASGEHDEEEKGRLDAVREMCDALEKKKGITVVDAPTTANVTMEVLSREMRDEPAGAFGGKSITRMGDTIIRLHLKSGNEESDLKGMGLKDALYLCESRNISVTARGSGKVRDQSMDPGTPVLKNKKLILELN